MRKLILLALTAVALSGCANTYVAGDLGPGRLAEQGR